MNYNHTRRPNVKIDNYINSSKFYNTGKTDVFMPNYKSRIAKNMDKALKLFNRGEIGTEILKGAAMAYKGIYQIAKHTAKMERHHKQELQKIVQDHDVLLKENNSLRNQLKDTAYKIDANIKQFNDGYSKLRAERDNLLQRNKILEVEAQNLVNALKQEQNARMNYGNVRESNQNFSLHNHSFAKKEKDIPRSTNANMLNPYGEKHNPLRQTGGFKR